MRKSNHIVLAGLNFQMKRSTGDKNFWVDLIPFIAKDYEQISLISIRKNDHKYAEYKIGKCAIKIHYISPTFLETPDANYRRPKIFWRKGAFPAYLGIIEKLFSGVKICNKLKRIYREIPFSHVHLMDNFGFFNQIISIMTPYSVSVSAMAYQGKKKLIYDKYLLWSYNHSNITVVPYSEAFSKKLREIGVGENKIVHIPWGIKLPCNRQQVEEKNRIKSSLSIPYKKTLFLWAGYIQQIQQKDFLHAVKIAMKSLNMGLNGIFFFAFKPENIKKGFLSFHNPEKGIIIEVTTSEKFTLLKSIADIFYSPVTNKNCIPAPPLTWIELMGFGVPILTTDIQGVDEIVVNGKTGYTAKSNVELIEKMFTIEKRYQAMRSDCQDKVFNSFNIQNTARSYINLWNHGVHQ